MRFVYFTTLALVTLLFVACATTDSSLNSDRIVQTFGSYGVDVIQSDDERRISSLYSGSGSRKTTRTYAVVDFIGSANNRVAREHALIESGRSIGEAFRSAGWTIRKQNLFIGELEVPGTYSSIGERMKIVLPETLATHVYLFVVEKDEGSLVYASITEIHHPDYLSAADLREIYGEILFDDSERDSIADFIGPPNSAK